MRSWHNLIGWAGNSLFKLWYRQKSGVYLDENRVTPVNRASMPRNQGKRSVNYVQPDSTWLRVARERVTTAYRGLTPIKAGQTQCLICAMGKFAEDNDAGRQGDCKECPAGWFGLPTGLCDPCPESTYQDQTGQATCKSCTVDSGGNVLQKPLSAPSSTDVSDCFDGDGLITYVFGMKDDAKEVQVETSECEIQTKHGFALSKLFLQ